MKQPASIILLAATIGMPTSAINTLPYGSVNQIDQTTIEPASATQAPSEPYSPYGNATPFQADPNTINSIAPAPLPGSITVSAPEPTVTPEAPNPRPRRSRRSRQRGWTNESPWISNPNPSYSPAPTSTNQITRPERITLERPNGGQIYWSKPENPTTAAFSYVGIDVNHLDEYRFGLELYQDQSFVGMIAIGDGAIPTNESGYHVVSYNAGSYVSPADGQTYQAPTASNYSMRVVITRNGTMVTGDASDGPLTLTTNPNALQRLGFAVREWFGFN